MLNIRTLLARLEEIEQGAREAWTQAERFIEWAKGVQRLCDALYCDLMPDTAALSTPEARLIERNGRP